MSTGNRNNLLNYLRTIIGNWRDDPRSDAELLTRFAQTRDESAFTALVSRHGGLVWRTCRTVLGDGPDAEDAFQAAFLRLASKAGQLRAAPLAGWLHRMARRIALDARAGTGRRQDLEQRLRALPRDTSEGGDNKAELYEILQEELAGLPERQRVPLVLHYLEGKTLEEVARILGCARSTLARRLARGEEVLRCRLSRRGLTLAGGTLGALLAQSAVNAAVPASLMGRAIEAALATPLESSALSLVSAVVGGLFSRRLLLAAMALLLVGGISLFALSMRANPTDPQVGQSNLPADSEPTTPENPSAVIVWGRILDASDKPVPKARVALMSRPPATVNNPLPGDDLVCKGETDAEGRYRLEGVPVSRRDVKLAASGEGYALAAVVVPIPNSKRIVEWNVRLSAPREIRGRLEGRLGAQGLDVEVIQVGPIRKPLRPLDIWERTQLQQDFFAPLEVVVKEGNVLSIKGVDPALGVRVRLNGNGAEIIELGNQETSPVRKGPAGGEADLSVLRRSLEGRDPAGVLSFAHVLAESPRAGVIVAVRKGDTKEVLDKVRVWIGPVKEENQRQDFLGPFRSIGEGDSVMVPYVGGKGPVMIHVCPPDDSPYLAIRGTSKEPPASWTTLPVSLPRGVSVRGVVSEDGMKKCLAGATVQYVPRERLGDAYRNVITGRAGLVRADGEGRFRIVVPPGPGYLLIDSPDEGFDSETAELTKDGKAEKVRAHRIVKIDVPADTEKYDVNATLHLAKDVTVH